MINKILAGEISVSVIGLGYVGIPLAIAFSEKNVSVIGFDVNKEKIELYKNGQDPTNEVGTDRIRNSKNIVFTSEESSIKSAKFHIIAVPTPVGKNNIPNLFPVESASIVVGRNLTRGSIVVYESTVYPGVTEEICVPILEKESGLKFGIDFKVGYSPERINPGDKVNTLENIMKIVSGQDEESLETIAKVYEIVIKAGVYKASSIKVAEAAKVIENSQRDVNIAFVNELAMIFDKMGIDTKDVLAAAGTKWNFLKFQPGLVGGHCIGVDPYYLTYKSEEMGYLSQLILSGRRINDGMSKFIAEKVIKMLIKADIKINGAKILVMGLTFKENVPDLRNSKVADVIFELKEYGINVEVVDPVADKKEAEEEYGIILKDIKKINNVDAVIVAVNHNEYKNLEIEEILSMYNKDNLKYIFVDIKGMFDKNIMNEKFEYWRL